MNLLTTSMVVSQKHLTGGATEKYKLVEFCPLLASVSPSVLGKLAEAVSWETLPENTSM